MRSLIHFFALFRRYAGNKLFLLIGTIIFGGLFESIGIAMFLPIMNIGREMPSDDRVSRFFSDVFDTIGVDPTFSVLLFLMVIVFTLKGVGVLVQKLITTLIRTSMHRDIRTKMVEKYVLMDYHFFSNTRTGYLSNIISVEIGRMVATFMRLAHIIVNLGYVIIYAIISAAMNLQLTIMMGIFGLFVIFVSRPLLTKSREYSNQTSNENASLQTEIIQLINSFVYVKATNTWRRLHGQLQRHIDRLRHLEFRLGLIGGSMSLWRGAKHQNFWFSSFFFTGRLAGCCRFKYFGIGSTRIWVAWQLWKQRLRYWTIIVRRTANY